MKTVKDLTIEELKTVVGEVVEEKLLDLFTDPDVGLSLRPEIKARLTQQLRSSQSGEANVPAAEVARRLGLEW